MINCLKACKDRSAFTIIELLVTFSIIGILASLAIPAFSLWLPNYRLKSAAVDLYSNLQLAKMQAVRNNGEYAVVFDTGTTTYQLISGGADGDYSSAGDNVTEKTVTLSGYGSGVGYGTGNAATNWSGNPVPGDGVSYNPERVVFNSRGMTNSIGYVYLDNTKNDKTFAVGTLLTGVVRLRRWNGASWD